MSDDGADLHAHAGAANDRQRPLGDRDLAERRRVDVVDHHLVACAEVARSSDQRAVGGRDALDHRVELVHLAAARGRPRSSGAVSVSTRSQRSRQEAAARREIQAANSSGSQSTGARR